jgi:hypothetical protein
MLDDCDLLAETPIDLERLCDIAGNRSTAMPSGRTSTKFNWPVLSLLKIAVNWSASQLLERVKSQLAGGELATTST